MKGDAQSVLRFLETHFDAITQFYRVQKRENRIVKETFFEICDHSKINSRVLQDYRIVKPNGNGDYELSLDYEKFIGFLLNDFKQTLTDSLVNLSKGLTTLFEKLQNTSEDNYTKISIIQSIIDLLKILCDDIEKRTYQLWQEYLELKSNKDGQYNYVSKLTKVNFWIKNHIEPLNAILNHHHSESIIYTIRLIKNYANTQKENHPVSEIRYEFDKLNDQLFFSDHHLQSQSKRLTDTLLPLLDRIKTEHKILSGFIEILKAVKNKQGIEFPPLFRKNRFALYNLDIDIAKIFEKYKKLPPVYAEDSNLSVTDFWHFDKQHYKSLLIRQLPLNNFMLWCHNTLHEAFGEANKDRFFALTTLLFEPDLMVEVGSQTIELDLFPHSINAPIIKVQYGAKLP
jgi:hypothetical protein